MRHTNMTIRDVVKTCSSFSGAWRIVTVSVTDRHWSYAEPDKFDQYYFHIVYLATFMSPSSNILQASPSSSLRRLSRFVYYLKT